MFDVSIKTRMSTSNSITGSFSFSKTMQKPDQKGEHSCTGTELSFKRKDGIVANLALMSNQNVLKGIWNMFKHFEHPVCL